MPRCSAHIVVFIGLFAIFNSLAGFIWDFTIKPFPSPFGEGAHVGGLITNHQIGMIAVTFAVLVLLFAFFRFTRIGLAMRAAAENPASARLVGIRVGWMVALGWGMAAAIGADRRHPDRADRLPRAEHDAVDPALRLRRRRAGRPDQPRRRGLRRLRGRHHRGDGRDLYPGDRRRVETADRAGADRHRPGVPPDRPVRPRSSCRGSEMPSGATTPPRPALAAESAGASKLAGRVPGRSSDWRSLRSASRCRSWSATS